MDEFKTEAIIVESGKSVISRKIASDFSLLSNYRKAIMGFAALWILFFHEWQPLLGEAAHLGQVEVYLKRIGFCGVDIFLFLSGIGMIFSIQKKSLCSFYYRRFQRLFLPFFVVCLLRFLTEHWEIQWFWKNLTGYNFYHYNIYAFLWFVPAIATLYLLFPLYHKLFSKTKNPLFFTVTVFALWLLLTLYFRGGQRQDLFGFTNRIPVFIVGIYTGWLIQNKSIQFTPSVWVMLSSIFVLGLYEAYIANFKGWGFTVPSSNCCFPNLLISISLPFLLAKGLDLLHRVPYIRVVGKGITKFLAFFGGISLELYCIQEWLGEKMIPKVQASHGSLVTNFIFLLLVTTAALGLHLTIQYFWKLVDFGIEKIKTPHRM